MYGLEFMLRHEGSGGFFGWLAYSVGRSERRFARRPAPDLGDDWDAADWVLHDMDQTHHLEAVGSWQLGGNWSFGSRLQYVSGVPTTPLLSYTSNQFEYDADTGDYVPIGGAYFSERIEPYLRVDLRLDKTWVKQRSLWSVYLDLQNANYFVYNSPEGYTYNYDYSQPRGVRLDLHAGPRPARGILGGRHDDELHFAALPPPSPPPRRSSCSPAAATVSRTRRCTWASRTRSGPTPSCANRPRRRPARRSR